MQIAYQKAKEKNHCYSLQTGHAVFDAKVASLEQHLRDRRRQWILLKSELGIEILTIFEENNRLVEKTATMSS
jgi:hypothetical protein